MATVSDSIPFRELPLLFRERASRKKSIVTLRPSGKILHRHLGMSHDVILSPPVPLYSRIASEACASLSLGFQMAFKDGRRTVAVPAIQRTVWASEMQFPFDR